MPSSFNPGENLQDAKSAITIQTYNNAAKAYQDKFMDMDLYNETYDSFCLVIPKRSPKILEIGCGPGNVTRYLLSKRPDFLITGIDLAPNMIDLAKTNNPHAEFRVMDARDIFKLDTLFDAIICGFCMPYLSREDCNSLIANSAKILAPGGIFYFSTMEDDYSRSGFETTSFSGDNKVFIYYHQAEYLNQCLLQNGFSIASLKRIKYPEPDGTFLTDMIFMAIKL